MGYLPYFSTNVLRTGRFSPGEDGALHRKRDCKKYKTIYRCKAGMLVVG